jgi:hypothetical protein
MSKVYREWCNFHNKWGYVNRKSAKYVAKQHKEHHKGVYLCGTMEDVPRWHVGRLDPNVIAGVLTREERYVA